MDKRIAAYPGSFDPITYGHLDILERAQKLFDEIVIVVGENVHKKALFTSQERVDMIEQVTTQYTNVRVAYHSGLLLDFLKQHNINLLLRGLRAVSDFEDEFQRALLHRELDADIETVFIMTKDTYAFLSSRAVREIASFNGDVSSFVPTYVQEKLREKYKDGY